MSDGVARLANNWYWRIFAAIKSYAMHSTCITGSLRDVEVACRAEQLATGSKQAWKVLFMTRQPYMTYIVSVYDY